MCSFRITIKTRLVLQRLLNYNPVYDQPMYAQHHSAQPVHKDDEKIDDDDLLQRQKLLAKEPEIPEKYVELICKRRSMGDYLVLHHENSELYYKK